MAGRTRAEIHALLDNTCHRITRCNANFASLEAKGLVLCFSLIFHPLESGPARAGGQKAEKRYLSASHLSGLDTRSVTRRSD